MRFMMANSLVKAVLASIAALPLLLAGPVLAAEKEGAGPTPSNKMAKPLKAIQDALNAKNYDEARRLPRRARTILTSSTPSS